MILIAHINAVQATQQSILRLCLTLLACSGTIAFAQQAPVSNGGPSVGLEVNSPSLTDRLDVVADILDLKRLQRDELTKLIAGSPRDGAVEERERLLALNDDITRLRATFELLAVGNVDLELVNEPVTEYDWQQEVVEIVAPLLESLKAVTKRPRQKTQLRESIELAKARLVLANKALESLESLPQNELDLEAIAPVQQLIEKWQGERQSYEQDLIVDQTQLDRLDSTAVPLATTLWPAIKRFLLGRGLTLFLATLAAVAAWLFMRFAWWVFSTRALSKEQRRRRTWFRLLSYSYYILNFLVVIAVVIAVLYVREDLLMLALAVVLIAVTTLGLRRFIPAYLREARLLINLGSVREGERVMYQGLPWQVMSLNIQTVLRNPALKGVIRLPLETVSMLVSRPVRDKLWFPCDRNDYLLMPDGAFAMAVQLTPELVQVRVKGGMIQSWRTADFYALNINNISRGESFGIAVTFGFDYNLQPLSLSVVPSELKAAIEKALHMAGFSESVLDLLVELQAASASSIDYLIYATIDSSVAVSYFRIERLIQQACVLVANEQGWNIPYPQMTIHRLPIEAV